MEQFESLRQLKLRVGLLLHIAAFDFWQTIWHLLQPVFLESMCRLGDKIILLCLLIQVEDNKLLATKIETSINSANHEVNILRGELEDTNRRLSMISESTEEIKLPREPDNDCEFLLFSSFF